MTDGGDVVMRPVPAAKGCTVCDGCASFSPGSDNERVCGKPRCGHREVEHAPCVRKQYQFPIDQFNHRCGECGLYPSAHVEAEHAPCALTREEFSSMPFMVIHGRCSACGLDVGRHLRDPGVKPPARRMRVDADPDLLYLMSFSVPNGTSLLHFRTHAFRIAADCHAFRRDDEGRGNCITYTGEVLPYALSFELYFKSEDHALEFIRRIYGCLPGNHEVPASVPEAVIVSRPSCLKQLLSRDHEISAKVTPREVGRKTPLADHMTHGSPSDSLSVEDIEFEALQTRDYYLLVDDKPEACRIVPRVERKPHNRLIMTRLFHAWFDGTPQMTASRTPSLFFSLGEGSACADSRVPGRVFVPIRLYFDSAKPIQVVLEASKHLVLFRRVGAENLFPTVRVDDRTFEVWVGFLDGGKSPEEVRGAVGAALATRLRPDQVAPAPLTALELDQSPLTDDEGDETMG